MRDHYDESDDYDNADEYGQRGRRRWPIVTAALVLLVLVLGGGGYGAWLYNQRQYYVGVQDGKVAIFRGTNQSVLGISLSSLVSTSTLPVSQLNPDDQASVAQTISKGSVNDAQLLIDGLQAEVDHCRSMYNTLVRWQTANLRYQSALRLARTAKAREAVKGNPGTMPAWPNAATCAPPAAFHIAPSKLPSTQTPTATATVPAPAGSTSAKAVKSSSPKASQKPPTRSSPTPRATA